MSDAEQRDHWIRLFHRLEAAVNHHAAATAGFRETHDEALYAALARVLKAAHDGPATAGRVS